MTAFVTIDAGTGGGKSIIFDETGTILGAHHEAWQYDLHLNPDVPFVKEFSFSAPAFWDTLCRCVRRALNAAGIRRADVAGVAATSQREGCVFLDAAGDEVYAGPNIDARGFSEGIEILNQLGAERLYQITGHSAPFIFPLARYLWFRKHGTRTVAHVLMISDWLGYRLTGEVAAEPSNATESMLFDLEMRCWSDEILRTFDIPRATLPPLKCSGERLGSITAAAAAATGLRPGTPVFVGGADTQCSLLGAGATEPFTTAATLGTTTPLQTVVARAVFDPQQNLWAGCHVVPDRWVIESNAGDTGDAYLWLLELLSGGGTRAELLRMGEQLAVERFGPPTMLFVGPSTFNLNSMRLHRPGGILFPFPALHVRPDRATLLRGFLESIGYALRANIAQLDAVTGQHTQELTLSGGMSRSAVLNRIIAEVTGLRVRVAAEPESAALGCAILMAANDGGLAAAVQRMVRHTCLEPDLEQHARYEAPYAKWRQLDEQLENLEL